MNTALLKNKQMIKCLVKKLGFFHNKTSTINTTNQMAGWFKKHILVHIAAQASDVLSPSSLFGSPLSIGADSGNFGGDLSSGSAPCQQVTSANKTHQKTRK